MAVRGGGGWVSPPIRIPKTQAAQTILLLPSVTMYEQGAVLLWNNQGRDPVLNAPGTGNTAIETREPSE